MSATSGKWTLRTLAAPAVATLLSLGCGPGDSGEAGETGQPLEELASVSQAATSDVGWYGSEPAPQINCGVTTKLAVGSDKLGMFATVCVLPWGSKSARTMVRFHNTSKTSSATATAKLAVYSDAIDDRGYYWHSDAYPCNGKLLKAQAYLYCLGPVVRWIPGGKTWGDADARVNGYGPADRIQSVAIQNL
jgi:hypothetical protein